MDLIIIRKQYGAWTFTISKYPDSSVHYFDIVANYTVRPNIVDRPIRYNDGKVGYDFPERIPKYVKAIVRKMFKEYDEFFPPTKLSSEL